MNKNPLTAFVLGEAPGLGKLLPRLLIPGYSLLNFEDRLLAFSKLSLVVVVLKSCIAKNNENCFTSTTGWDGLRAYARFLKISKYTFDSCNDKESCFIAASAHCEEVILPSIEDCCKVLTKDKREA